MGNRIFGPQTKDNQARRSPAAPAWRWPLKCRNQVPIVFIDDSGSGGSSPYFVLSGYGASLDVWHAFAADWQGVLDLPPKVEYFKMNEAHMCEGQFAGFTPAER